MDLTGTIYEAGGFTMLRYSKDFIDTFLSKEADEALKDGMTDKDYLGVKSNMPHYRKPLLVAYKIADGVWSLNLAQDPDSVIAQIDHNKKLLRTPETSTPEALTAQIYTVANFKKLYKKHNDPKRRAKGQSQLSDDSDYGMSTEIIDKDWTNSKYITKLDISKLWKA